MKRKKVGRKAKAPVADGCQAVKPADEVVPPRSEEAQSARRKKKRKRAAQTLAKDEAIVETLPVAKASVPAAAAGHATVGAVASGDAAWPALEAWLRKGGATLDALEVRTDGPSGGLGAFARRALAAGEVVFTIPTELMLTGRRAVEDAVVARVAALLRSWGEEDMPHLIMCLRLCRARSRTDDPFHLYATSLPSTAPQAASWPPAFRDFLATTSLGPALTAADSELDRWDGLLHRVAKAEPDTLGPPGAFDRAHLEWARGMLQSRGFPGGFSGTAGEQSLCMVPLLDVLNHKNAVNVTVRARAELLEYVCGEAVPTGQQIWNNYGSKGNAELMMCYGFAISGNNFDTVPLGLAAADSAASGASSSEVLLTLQGVPQDLIDSIEEEQNSTQFVALLKAVLLRKRATKECLDRLPKALNFDVCKGALNRARKRSIEAFLEGQLMVLDACMESMQTASDEKKEEEEDEGEEDSNADDEDGDEEEEDEVELPQRKRRRKGR